MNDRQRLRAAEVNPAGSGLMYIRAQINGPIARSWLREHFEAVVCPEWSRLSEEDRQKIKDLQALDRPKTQ